MARDQLTLQKKSRTARAVCNRYVTVRDAIEYWMSADEMNEEIAARVRAIARAFALNALERARQALRKHGHLLPANLRALPANILEILFAAFNFVLVTPLVLTSHLNALFVQMLRALAQQAAHLVHAQADLEHPPSPAIPPAGVCVMPRFYSAEIALSN
jgi:hypothetical protein